MDREILHNWARLLAQHINESVLNNLALPDSPFLHRANHQPAHTLPAPRFEDDALWVQVIQQDDSAALQISESEMLFPDCHANRALEVWTECELSGLQALVWISLHRQAKPLLARATDAAAWHLENTQPDNATNHPWGIPAFLCCAMMHESLAREAELYASTLLHNCLVTTGQPDALSQLVLRDARAQCHALLESSLQE